VIVRKFFLAFCALLSAVGFLTAEAHAANTTFTVSATVPSASGVSISVDSVNATSNAFTQLPAGSTALSFDPMTFNTTYSVYLPSVYYALNFGVVSGSGEPDVTFTYNEGTNPNAGNSSNPNGLGHKASATFAQESSSATFGSGETLLPAHPKAMLANVQGTHVAYTELAAGSYLRVYLGICTGNTSTDPSGCQPFTNSDAAGTYTGSLVATATVN
jgi:hypothetical protein